MIHELRGLSVLLAALLPGACSYATGPSHLYLRMLPVSVNDEGMVLCRTVSLSNPVGISGFMPASFGWAVIDPAGSITRYHWFTIDPHEMESDEEIAEAYETAWIESLRPVDFDAPPASLQSVTAEFGFDRNNAHEYSVNRMLSYREFIDFYRLDRDSMMQLALGDGYSVVYHDSVFVSHDFGRTLLLENSRDPNTGTVVGAEFQTLRSLYPKEYWDYESYTVTGVVFIR